MIWWLIIIITFSLLIAFELLTKEDSWINGAKLLSSLDIQWQFTPVGTTFCFQNHIFVSRNSVPPSTGFKLGGHWREILLPRRNALDPNCIITGGNSVLLFFVMILRAIFVYSFGFVLLVFNHIWTEFDQLLFASCLFFSYYFWTSYC